VRSALRVAGEACLTVGVLVGLFAAYLVWGTGPRAAQAQDQFAQQLNRAWRAGPASPSEAGRVPAPAVPDRVTLVTGEPFAFLRIPAFGAQWRFTIIQGTQLAQLNVSPGHVPGTQLPGQLGNFAVAGHRVTAGNPFWSLPDLTSGDMVYVDTSDDTYAYRILARPAWVAPTDMSILDPVPGHPDTAPTRRLITLITCDPAWTGAQRVIATGVLESVTGRTASVSQGASANASVPAFSARGR
jgi:sortase A